MSKVNSASRTCGTTSNGLLYVYLELQNQKEAERTHLQQTYTIRNANGYHLGIREMILKHKDQSRDHVNDKATTKNFMIKAKNIPSFIPQ